MHDQMSGYKRLRRDHQASLARLEESCRQEMEKHKQMLDREYEQLLTQFSRELERLQLKHQDEVKKLICTLLYVHQQMTFLSKRKLQWCSAFKTNFKPWFTLYCSRFQENVVTIRFVSCLFQHRF